MPPILAAFFELSGPAFWMSAAGLNYFADTLLFGGTILSLARATTVSA